jgi:hydroxymethylpyrimidine/phosphomethylpyrimidine kinase
VAPRVALSIAGSDPSGGAGIQADLKTFHQFGVYGEAVIALLTVQNTCKVTRVEILDPDLVEEQVRAVLEDIPPGAVKTGALGNAAVVRRVAQLAPLFRCPLVVDPVMISKHGAPLIADEARAALWNDLLHCATLITPNLHEAAALAGFPVESLEQMREAARRLRDHTGAAILVKGGHLEGDAVDLLWDGESFREFRAERIDTPHTHGTGCTYSAAITALLALGAPLSEAVRRAKAFISEAIRTNPGLGSGCGPVNHHARPLQ